MKFIIEVLPDWPLKTKTSKRLKHNQNIPDSEIHFLLHDDDITITSIVFQSPELNILPRGSILRIRQIE